MSALLAPPRRVLPPPPRPVYVTAAEFHRLWDSGFFSGLRRVILVDGQMIELPMPDPPHDGGVTALKEFLEAAFPAGHYVRNQQGFDAGLDTDPGPDLAVVPGTWRDYLKAHPRQAVLIAEVANTSLSYDRGRKAHIYAAAGVPEYWVLDVLGRQLLVFRDPVADPQAERGWRYATQLTLSEGDTASPQAAPAATVLVRGLLP